MPCVVLDLEPDSFRYILDIAQAKYHRWLLKQRTGLCWTDIQNTNYTADSWPLTQHKRISTPQNFSGIAMKFLSGARQINFLQANGMTLESVNSKFVYENGW